MGVTKAKTFWITNITNRNVSLTDLNITINAFSSVNLLDNKHYYYTLEQLEKSALEGSLSKKSKMLYIRKVEPVIFKMATPLLSETFMPSRERSIYNIKEEKYEELNFSDEDFANQNAEIADLDRIPNKKV